MNDLKILKIKKFKLSLDNFCKIVVILALIVAASTKQQYSYYTFIRWLVTITSIYFAYTAFENKQTGTFISFMGIALFFNPLFKIWFQRETWQLIDCIVAIVTSITMFYQGSKKTSDLQKTE